MSMASFFQDIGLQPLSLLVGGMGGALMVTLWMGAKLSKAERERDIFAAKLDSEKAMMGDHFQTLAKTALQSNNEQFLTLAAEKLKAAQDRGASDLDKRTVEIEKLVKPIEKELTRLNSLSEQMQGTDKSLKEELVSLQRETSKLTGVLRNPAARGKWGEFVLETILDKANLIKGVHYSTQEQVSSGGRPDVIINLHDGFRIAIDSKAPINEFLNRLDEDLSDHESASLQVGMAKAVRNHVKALGARSYQDTIEGSDFVILFLPSEAVFSATLRADPDIVDYASDNHVVIASPTLIMSLLRVVALSWRQVEMAKNAAEISELGADLYKRFSKFLEHFSKVGKGINSALSSYNDAVGSAERMVLPAAQRFVKLHAVAQNAALPDIAQIENAPRRMMNETVSDSDMLIEDNIPKVNNG